MPRWLEAKTATAKRCQRLRAMLGLERMPLQAMIVRPALEIGLELQRLERDARAAGLIDERGEAGLFGGELLVRHPVSGVDGV